ncbi:MAG: flavodoxin family protein [Desulfobacteraceae bacterium]|nr:flavodoxin family protein [Desulfobacteraceae bacterium]
MKVLGITCGRKMSNTEILVKEALMGAEEAGAEVEIVRLMDLNIKPCTGCNACVINLFEKGGAGECVIKDDDFKFIDEKILECDGLILGAPTYEKAPPGYLKTLNDRMGPSHDMAFRMIAKKIREEKGITKGEGPDERSFKTRLVSLFAVGGSDWTTLALPMLQIFALPMNMTVVDQQLFNWVALPASVALKDEMLQRARRSGRHVGETLKGSVENAEYIGPQGVCPVCNSSVLELGKTSDKALCAVCGVKGTLKTEGGAYSLEVTEEDRAHSHILLSGKFQHAEDLKNFSLNPDPRMDEIPKLIEKYKSYLQHSRPESKL